MDNAERIAQFENMCQADPENDMAHFSLGGAYAQSERYAEAAQSYLNCIKANDAMSKARQLAAECLQALHVPADSAHEVGVVFVFGR